MYQPGKWYVICDRCGRKRYSNEVSKEWTGVIVCTDTCLDMRSEQDFLRTPIDKQDVPFTRPSPTVDANWPNFADVTHDTTTGTQERTIPSGTFDNALD